MQSTHDNLNEIKGKSDDKMSFLGTPKEKPWVKHSTTWQQNLTQTMFLDFRTTTTTKKKIINLEIEFNFGNWMNIKYMTLKFYLRYTGTVMGKHLKCMHVRNRKEFNLLSEKQNKEKQSSSQTMTTYFKGHKFACLY